MQTRAAEPFRRHNFFIRPMLGETKSVGLDPPGMAAVAWKGFVSFGLVTFPVRLFAAARAQHVQFHMLHRKDLSRVKEVWYCADENKPIERADIVKGYETS